MHACWYALGRERGFAETVAEAGRTCRAFVDDAGLSRDQWLGGIDLEDPLMDWLQDLAMRVAVWAMTDGMAASVLKACEEAGVAVPDDVAVLGCDNDELVCETSFPRLSSIALPLEQVGRSVVAMLERQMAGRPLQVPDTLLPPSGIVERESTNIFGVEDPDVRTALAYIRDRADRNLSVGDVVEAVAVSRRRLEQKFKAALGRTPLQEIHRAHLSLARRLLRETDDAIQDVADASGFSSPARMDIVFQRYLEITPTEYRRQFRKS